MTVLTQALTSSFLSDTSYNTDTNVMMITFNNGKTYSYADVPIGIFNEFISAQSPGSYYSANIKGKFEEVK